MDTETTPAPRFVRVGELARELNLTRSVAYRFAQSIPHVKVKRTVLVERTALERVITEMKRTGAER